MSELVVPEEVWGSALEVGVAAKLLKVTIETFEAGRGKDDMMYYERISEALPADSTQRRCRIVRTGTHYNLLRAAAKADSA